MANKDPEKAKEYFKKWKEKIFESPAQFEKRVKERYDRQIKKNRDDIAKNGRGKKTQTKKPKIIWKEKGDDFYKVI